jgi:murein DD-endopeptidase MepM/ murein hydrolase activator NlpD
MSILSKNYRYSVLLFLSVFLVVIFLFWRLETTDNNSQSKRQALLSRESTPVNPALNNDAAANENSSLLSDVNSQKAEDQTFDQPITRASRRITKKPFGIYITPQNSPVQPERFSGYHTGTDFEVFPDEANQDVLIRAICQGNILFKEHVGGYGGALVQSCKYNNESVTVLYGHLNLDSITLKKDQEVRIGQEIGILGKGNTSQTDFERKHLHLSVHKGSAIDYRGYVNSQNQLVDWINPCDLLDCQFEACSDC